MKIIGVLILGILAGCSSYMSLGELEDEAIRTGDWSAVERRELILDRRAGGQGVACPRGSMSYCETWAGVKNGCRCVPRSEFREFLAGRR